MTETSQNRHAAATPDPGAAGRGREPLQYATFRLGSELFGIPILQVQEILLAQAITPVPRAPDYILGLLGLRGQIVTAVDLKRRLGVSAPAAESPCQIVARARESTAALQVDRIGDVMQVEASALQPPPESLGEVDTRFLEGVCLLEEEILAVLNVAAVLEVN